MQTYILQSNTFLGLFVGQNIVCLSNVDSTNNYLKELLTKSRPVPEGSVIMAVKQSAGRGQIGNAWHSEAGKNLTFSVVLYPSFLPIEQQFELTKAVSLALNDVLSIYFGPSAKIKWPNDCYIDDKKIGGILIENNIQGNLIKHSIIGIGLNINQSDFPSELKNVTSFNQFFSTQHELMTVLGQICSAIEARYLQLKAGNLREIGMQYLSNLYLLNQWNIYRINDRLQSGKICGIDPQGRLLVEIDSQIQSFGLKEISFNA